VRGLAPRWRTLLACAAAVLLGTSPLRVQAADPPGFIRFVGENLVATANGEFKDWRVAAAEIDNRLSARRPDDRQHSTKPLLMQSLLASRFDAFARNFYRVF